MPSPDADLLAVRLTSQRLAGGKNADVLETTRHLLAVQGQDPRGARLALRSRTVGTHASDIDRALTEERSLVITWVNRGTLHLVAAEDEPLLHMLTTPQLQRGNDRRLEQECVGPAAAERGEAAIVRALGENGPMARAQLRAVLEQADVPTAGQALVHLLFKATIDGLILRGPMIDGHHCFVLAADWLGERPKLDRDVALAELARRYFAGHGPADEQDLSRWAGLPLRDVRRGLAAIAGELHRRPDGLLDLPSRTAADLPPPRLLGPYDPVLLGWRSREFVLGDAQGIVTTNGLFRPFVLVDGRACGIWAMPNGRVDLRLWEEPSAALQAALAEEVAAVEAFMRLDTGRGYR
jgi:winged helix DNA-binding protein